MSLPDGVERRSFDGETELATRGEAVYGEATDGEWRRWDVRRSKLGAMFDRGVGTGFVGAETVLYLGAAAGTTVSHVADACGPTYAVEFAARPARDLLDVAESRPNLFPLLKDARRPETGGIGESQPATEADLNEAPLEEPASATSDHRVVDWAISELERDHDQPFFLGAGILRPHIPWYVPQTFYDQYPLEDIVVPPAPPGDLDDLPPRGQQIGSGRRHWHEWLVEEGLWAEAMQGYLASVSFVDAQVGRLLDALESSDHADDTVVVLWSDHGFHLGEKEAWEKFTLWEESGRVPLMIRAPGVTEPRQRCDEPVSLLDLYPTLTELCGLKTPEGVEGQSLVPLLEDPNRDTDRVAITTWNYQNHSVRSKRWRYIRYRTGEEELYDHDFDPGEYHNLADQKAYEPIKERLAARLPEVNRRAYDP